MEFSQHQKIEKFNEQSIKKANCFGEDPLRHFPDKIHQITKGVAVGIEDREGVVLSGTQGSGDVIFDDDVRSSP